MRVGIAGRRADQRARDAEHPRRALGHLQGRVRRAPVDGPAAGRRAGRLRGIPQAARRARDGRGARRAVRPQSRPRGAADVLRRRGVQGSVRHEGHAHDVEQRRRTSRWTCRRSTRRSSRSCARRARSSTRSPSRTSSTRAPAIPAAPTKSRFNWPQGGQQISSWSGQPCNPYDTERVVRGSSGGSGAAIGGNLAMIGICEQSGASCQGPASRNGTALILTTKGHHSGQRRHRQPVVQRPRGNPRAHARGCDARARCAEGSGHTGYYDPRDPFTALPKALMPEQPYASFIVGDAAVAGGAQAARRACASRSCASTW